MKMELCLWCEEEVEAADRADCQQPFHFYCLVRMVVGSIGHQLHRCSCYGGSEEDPPNISRQRAALAAASYWNLTHRKRA